MSTERTTVRDMVRELTERHKHVELFDYQTHGTAYTTLHVTDHPSLLEQLEAATTLLGNADDGVRLGYGSKPSARIDAIDALIRIEHESGELVKRPTIAESVRAVGALAQTLPACQVRDVDHDCCRRHVYEQQIQRWWTWCRLTTGWDRPPWRPDATCPICGKRGGLRIRLDEDHRNAMCTECKHTWDEETIGHLALHIKAESECTEDGCDQRVRKDGRCATHSVSLATQAASATVRGLGEVSPPPDQPRILNGVTTADHEEREHQRRTILDWQATG